MSKQKKKKESKRIYSLFLHLLKSPYYAGKGIYYVSKKMKEKERGRKTREKRESIVANYEDFDVIDTQGGNFKNWEKELIESDSKIGLVLGARGSGKTAFGIKLLENLYSKKKKKCYAMGLREENMPMWIKIIDDVGQIENNSIVLIDEGGILFSSRKSMTNANKLLGDLILISRHKNLSILFISQNSSNLDVNILRQADFLILKKTSLLQKDFERKKIKEIYKEVSEHFKKYQNYNGITHIYSDKFRGFVSNPLPSFWKEKISKSFE